MGLGELVGNDPFSPTPDLDRNDLSLSPKSSDLNQIHTCFPCTANPALSHQLAQTTEKQWATFLSMISKASSPSVSQFSSTPSTFLFHFISFRNDGRKLLSIGLRLRV